MTAGSFHVCGALQNPFCNIGTRQFWKTACTLASVHESVRFVRARCMAAAPYVSMNPSVTSDRGQPTPSPLRIGALTPEVFLMSHRSWLNPAQVVGTFRLWLVKNEELYQKPGLTLPVYAPPQTLPVTVSGSSAPG